MRMYYDGECENSECSARGECREFYADGVQDGRLVGVECDECHGRIHHLFSAPHVGGMTRKSAAGNDGSEVTQQDIDKALGAYNKARRECAAQGKDVIAGLVELEDDGDTKVHALTKPSATLN
ncbi:MAG: hypothetical protein PHI23_00610 [Candidatus Peribacteraceae bacterium]|nr:hypothetical protein [Candidatus Peribacteraceae bacterium]